MPTQSKFTAQVRASIIAYVGAGCTLPTAAERSGVHRATLNRWMEEGSEGPTASLKRKFRDEVLQAQAEFLGKITDVAVQGTMNEMDRSLAVKILGLRDPEWRKREEVKVEATGRIELVWPTGGVIGVPREPNQAAQPSQTA